MYLSFLNPGGNGRVIGQKKCGLSLLRLARNYPAVSSMAGNIGRCHDRVDLYQEVAGGIPAEWIFHRE